MPGETVMQSLVALVGLSVALPGLAVMVWKEGTIALVWLAFWLVAIILLALAYEHLLEPLGVGLR
jgi:predicted lysophospholipase L1 biosynthesis ABC-type transport system permease subunit